MSAVSVKPQIKRSKLGQSSLVVSEVCLGCMNFGSMVAEEKAYQIMDIAFAAGVNFFDTAEMYPFPRDARHQGRSSEILGSWVKSRGIKREDIVLATKVSGHADGSANGFITANRTVPPSAPTDCRLDAASIKAATDAELRRLGVDYIDLMQLHWPDRYVPSFGEAVYDVRQERQSISFEEQVQAMADLIKAGKIRHWGISNETSYGTVMICLTADRLGCPRPVSVQNAFSLICRTFETEMAETCSERHLNLPLLPWSPGGFGVLSGKYLGGKIPEESRYGICKLTTSRRLSERVSKAVREYVDIAKRFDLKPIQLAYMFCKSRFFVGSTIIGVSNVEQLEEDLIAFQMEIPAAALKAIDDVHQRMPNPEIVYS